MIRSWLLAATLLVSAPLVLAQTPGGKKELALKIVQLQQPAVEGLARQMVEAPAAQLLQQAGQAVQQRVAADRRESVWQDIQADARRYVDDALPTVRDRALKLAPTTLAPLLEERLSEDELRQVLQIMQQLDSPVYRKYLALSPDLQKALGEKLVAETRAQVEPKMQTLQSNVAKRLGVSPNKPAEGGGAAPKK
ncbi:MAG: hypothetical protein JNJ71_16675 [Rubrivivax sp.]|nr:hypothetical protein [Rubrivivax sp.]